MTLPSDEMRTVRLTESDFARIKKMELSIPDVFKGASGTKVREAELPKSNDRYFSRLSPSEKCFAIMLKETPISAIKIYRWASLPYHSVNSFFLDAKSEVPFLVALNLLMERAIEAMEADRCFTFFTAARLRPSYLSELRAKGTLERVFKDLPAYKNYDFVTEEIILAGQQSKAETFRKLVNETVWDCPIIIRRATLKEEIRTQILLTDAKLR